jgi:hypothetical protein
LEKTFAAHWGFSILRVPSSKDFQETKTPRRRATSPVRTRTFSSSVLVLVASRGNEAELAGSKGRVKVGERRGSASTKRRKRD